MAQRTVCLCGGKYIGIESIFTVVNGKQINIPEKVEALREKSRQNLLTCPCGCGSILTLVAGDRNLREQHFRLKDGENEKECHLVTEGKCSVDSKIVLKCWLDDKLNHADIEARVPIFAVNDCKRKYEFTFLSREKSIAISYSHERVNLSDEKFDILESNGKNINIIYIVDISNGGVLGQYPESLMKIQSRQGYCLYLSIEDNDYYKAELEAVFFEQDVDGFWREISVAKGPLTRFNINEDGKLSFEEKILNYLIESAKDNFHREMEEISRRRDQEECKKAEIHKKEQEEKERRERERINEINRKQAEFEKKQKELAEKKRLEDERKERERKEKEEAFKKELANNFDNQTSIIRDQDGNRWIKCEFCGKIAMDKEFSSYGGTGKLNLGTCYDCSNNNPAVQERLKYITEKKKTIYNPNICPECGGQLKEKNGKYGSFIGCSNYPRCRYTRNKR